MALLAESLVEEWLNRKSFFTIRGVKHGVREMDLLAIRRQQDGTVAGWHVEVQVSFRPVGYICKTTDELVGKTDRSKSSAKSRTQQQLESCATKWVDEKFRSPPKAKVRDQLWPGLTWTHFLVHGVVREQRELECIRKLNVQVIPFTKILLEICHTGPQELSASAGGDLAEVVRYYRDNCPLNEYQ